MKHTRILDCRLVRGTGRVELHEPELDLRTCSLRIVSAEGRRIIHTVQTLGPHTAVISLRRGLESRSLQLRVEIDTVKRVVRPIALRRTCNCGR